MSLGSLLSSYAHCSCTSLHDKVFAILGLLNGEQAMAIGRYLPNYSLSYEEVKIIALATIIEYDHTETLELKELFEFLFSWRGQVEVAQCFQTLYPGKEYTDDILRRHGLVADAQHVHDLPDTDLAKKFKIDKFYRFVLNKCVKGPESTDTVRTFLEEARLMHKRGVYSISI
jgi:hypothetical protein